MTEDNELRYVVGAIYDAALNPTLWPGVLARIAAFVGGPSRELSARDLMWLLVNTDEHVGHDVKYVQTFKIWTSKAWTSKAWTFKAWTFKAWTFKAWALRN